MPERISKPDGGAGRAGWILGGMENIENDPRNADIESSDIESSNIVSSGAAPSDAVELAAELTGIGSVRSACFA